MYEGVSYGHWSLHRKCGPCSVVREGKDAFTVRMNGGWGGFMADRTVLARGNFLWPGGPLHTLAASLNRGGEDGG